MVKTMDKPSRIKTPPAAIAAAPAESCVSCRFYMMPEGLCRRMPPQVIGAATGKKQADGNPVMAWMSVFPQMSHVGWCGEFKARGNA